MLYVLHIVKRVGVKPANLIDGIDIYSLCQAIWGGYSFTGDYIKESLSQLCPYSSDNTVKLSYKRKHAPLSIVGNQDYVSVQWLLTYESMMLQFCMRPKVD